MLSSSLLLQGHIFLHVGVNAGMQEETLLETFMRILLFCFVFFSFICSLLMHWYKWLHASAYLHPEKRRTYAPAGTIIHHKSPNLYH